MGETTFYLGVLLLNWHGTVWVRCRMCAHAATVATLGVTTPAFLTPSLLSHVIPAALMQQTRWLKTSNARGEPRRSERQPAAAVRGGHCCIAAGARAADTARS